MTPRIAVCIAGQVRTDEAGLRQIRAGLPAGARIFVSTWRQGGGKTAGALNCHQLARILGPAGYAALPERWADNSKLGLAFPALRDRLDAALATVMGDMSEAALAAVFPDAAVDVEDGAPLSLEFPAPVGDSNSLRMLYKNWRCNEMKRRAEAAMGARFDVVIRVRPDMVPGPLKPDVVARLRDEPGRHCYNSGSAEVISDMVACTDSVTADRLSALFAKAMLAPQRPWTGIHQELKAHFAEHGIAHQYYPGCTLLPEPEVSLRARRAVILDLTEARDCAPDALPAERDFALFTLAWRAAIALEEGNAAGAARLLDTARPEGVAPDVVAGFLRVAGCVLARQGEAAAAYACTLLGWVQAMSWPTRADVAKLRLPVAIPIVLALAPDDPLLPFRADGGVAPFAHPRLPPWFAACLAGLDEAERDRRVAKVLELFWAERKSEVAKQLRIRFWEQFNRGERAEAETTARSIVEMAPDAWDGHDCMGHVLQARGDAEAALASARAAWERASYSGSLRARYAVLLSAVGRFRDAVEALEEAFRVWPDPRVWRWLAEAHRGAGELDAARAAIGKAIAATPGNAEYRRFAAQIGVPEGTP